MPGYPVAPVVAPTSLPPVGDAPPEYRTLDSATARAAGLIPSGPLDDGESQSSES